MPPPLARLRHQWGRHLRRAIAGGTGPHARGEGGGSQRIVDVPLTVRAQTADGADIRLLLDARLTSPTLPATELERMALALVVPAAAQWVRRQEVAALNASLDPSLPEVREAVREQVIAFGGELLTVELVALEHLLASPSADPADPADPAEPDDPAHPAEPDEDHRT